MKNPIFYRAPRQPTSFIKDVILPMVSLLHSMPVELILNPTRKREVVYVRQLAMKAATVFTNASLTDIGQVLAGKDHATVLHAKKTIQNLCDVDISVRKDYNTLYVKLNYKIMKKDEKILICSQCGNEDVEVKMWVNIKTEEISGPAGDETSDNFCKICNENVKLINKTDFDNESKPETLSEGLQESHKREVRQRSNQAINC